MEQKGDVYTRILVKVVAVERARFGRIQKTAEGTIQHHGAIEEKVESVGTVEGLRYAALGIVCGTLLDRSLSRGCLLLRRGSRCRRVFTVTHNGLPK
jgi:hypothetical protein